MPLFTEIKTINFLHTAVKMKIDYTAQTFCKIIKKDFCEKFITSTIHANINIRHNVLLIRYHFNKFLFNIFEIYIRKNYTILLWLYQIGLSTKEKRSFYSI